jgi:hypothetical protein
MLRAIERAFGISPEQNLFRKPVLIPSSKAKSRIAVSSRIV